MSLPAELKPCEHMVTLVSRRSDDTLTGPAKWYTDFHVLTCPECRAALAGLRALRKEVHDRVQAEPTDLPRLTPDQWKKVEEAWSGEA